MKRKSEAELNNLTLVSNSLTFCKAFSQILSFSSLSEFDSEHYIPLSIDEAPNRFKVAVLDSKPWKNTLSKPGQCVAQDFRHNILYNSKIKREPSKLCFIHFNLEL